MPSVNDTRRLLKRLDFLSSQIADLEAEIATERALRGEAIVRSVRAQAASLFDNALPASDARLAALEQRRGELGRRFSPIREEHWNLRRGVILGNYKDKLAGVVREHSRSSLGQHREAIDGWNGRSVSDLRELYMDYFTDCMACGMTHAEAVSDLSGRFVLDGHRVPLPELFQDCADPCVASDEDGNMLQMREWSTRVVPVADMDPLAGSKRELLSRVAEVQENFLGPVLADVLRGVRENGGAGIWFRSEMLAVEAFRPEWHYRRSQLATDLANTLFLELGTACGRLDRGLAESGLLESPYVRTPGGRIVRTQSVPTN